MAIDVHYLVSVLKDEKIAAHWLATRPQRGDHIRVRRLGGLYYHHGIYISDREVITFAGDDDHNPFDWWDTKVRATSLELFLQGGQTEVCLYTIRERQQLCSIEETVAFARACLGNEKYSLLFHNCEHFSNACKQGIYRSQQVERILRGQSLHDALACLDDPEQRSRWWDEAVSDLKKQVLSKIKRDLEAKMRQE